MDDIKDELLKYLNKDKSKSNKEGTLMTHLVVQGIEVELANLLTVGGNTSEIHQLFRAFEDFKKAIEEGQVLKKKGDKLFSNLVDSALSFDIKFSRNDITKVHIDLLKKVMEHGLTAKEVDRKTEKCITALCKVWPLSVVNAKG